MARFRGVLICIVAVCFAGLVMAKEFRSKIWIGDGPGGFYGGPVMMLTFYPDVYGKELTLEFHAEDVNPKGAIYVNKRKVSALEEGKNSIEFTAEAFPGQQFGIVALKVSAFSKSNWDDVGIRYLILRTEDRVLLSIESE